MAYGAVPLLGAVSSIPQMIGVIGAGVALPPHDVVGFANRIAWFARDSAAWHAHSVMGRQAAEIFTYDSYVEAVTTMFAANWGVEL
jgi:hypothetical protein